MRPLAACNDGIHSTLPLPAEIKALSPCGRGWGEGPSSTCGRGPGEGYRNRLLQSTSVPSRNSKRTVVRCFDGLSTNGELFLGDSPLGPALD